jgi:toxin-antitoxin system PIN domain toxin
VIAPDANLLIYAYAPSDPNHAAGKTWLEGILSNPEPVGLPIQTIYAFLRVVTNPRSTITPLTFSKAARVVNAWLEMPHVRILYPGDRHWELLQRLAEQVRVSGPQITDAVIAAIAIEYDAVIHTNNRDFARFPGLRWVNPLEASRKTR